MGVESTRAPAGAPADDARGRGRRRREPQHGLARGQRRRRACATTSSVRVRDAVELLGYRHNLTASTLRRADGQSASIGLIFEDVSNPFFGAVHRGVEDVARDARRAARSSARSDEEPERERELAEAFGARGVDGLIVATAVDDSSVPAARARRRRGAGLRRPAAELPRRRRGRHRQRGRRAHGGRAPDRGGPSPDRLPRRPAGGLHRRRAAAGVPETLAQHGLAEDLDLVRHPQFRGVDAYETTCELLRGNDPPTALFASQNLISIGAVRALHALGLQHEVAMVSFDDILLADALDPGLTVVAQDPHGLGPHRGGAAVRRGSTATTGRAATSCCRRELIERGSGELPPARRLQRMHAAAAIDCMTRDGAAGRHRRDRHGLDGPRAQRRRTGACSSTSRTSGCAPDCVMAADVSEERRAHAERVGFERTTDDWRAVIDDPARRGRQRHAARTSMHREVAVAALQAGKHVWVEKPVGRGLEDTAAVAEAARARGRRHRRRLLLPLRARRPARPRADRGGRDRRGQPLPRRLPRRLRQPPRRRRLVALRPRRTPARARSAT